MLITIKVNCSACGKEFEVEPYILKKQKNHYCGPDCYHKARKNWKPSKEHRKLVSERCKGRIFTPEWRQKLSEAKKGLKLSDEHRKNLSKAKKGKSNPKLSALLKGRYLGIKHWNWQGGKHADGYGYILIYMPDHPYADKRNCIREHRLILERHLGRYLKPQEETHHLGAKNDNRLHMLMLFINHSAHQKFEMNKPVKLSEIIFDGRKQKSEVI